MNKSKAEILSGITTSIFTPPHLISVDARCTSQLVASQSNIPISELSRLVVKLMQDGLLVLAVSYALKTDKDFVPILRKYVNDNLVEQYSEMLEELR